MADISKITLPNGSSYNFKDSVARSGLEEKASISHTHEYYATCATARSDINKVATLANFTLTIGATVVVKFTDTAGTANPTSGNLTLNVNNTGAKEIGFFRNGGKAAIKYISGAYFYNNLTHIFTYDGTYWLCMDWNVDNNTDTKVTNTLKTTTKAYVTGTTSAKTNTGTQIFDTGVYLDTTAGMLTATTFKGALTGNASTASALISKSIGSKVQPVYFDANGKPVATTYTLGKSVPSDAVFTDTTNSDVTASGNPVQMYDLQDGVPFSEMVVSGKNLPITGRDLTVNVCGKNLVDTTKYTPKSTSAINSVIDENGIVTVNADSTVTNSTVVEPIRIPISILKKECTLSLTWYDGTINDMTEKQKISGRVLFYDSTGTFIAGSSEYPIVEASKGVNKIISFSKISIPENAAEFSVNFWIAENKKLTNFRYGLQLEYGFTATAYEPYHGSTTTITPDSNPYVIPNDIRQADGLNNISVSEGEISAIGVRKNEAVKHIWQNLTTYAKKEDIPTTKIITGSATISNAANTVFIPLPKVPIFVNLHVIDHTDLVYTDAEGLEMEAMEVDCMIMPSSNFKIVLSSSIPGPPSEGFWIVYTGTGLTSPGTIHYTAIYE